MGIHITNIEQYDFMPCNLFYLFSGQTEIRSIAFSNTGFVICLRPGDMAIATTSGLAASERVPLWARPPPRPRPIVSLQSTNCVSLPNMFIYLSRVWSPIYLHGLLHLKGSPQA